MYEYSFKTDRINHCFDGCPLKRMGISGEYHCWDDVKIECSDITRPDGCGLVERKCEDE